MNTIKDVVPATVGQEGPFYSFDKDGKFLGCFAGFNVQFPAGHVGNAPTAPEHADDVWTGSEWVNSADFARSKGKAVRADAINSIVVTTAAGNAFDGDEISQGRMARAIIGLQAAGEGTTVKWVLHDNKAVDVTAAELTEALTKAGEVQSTLWVI